MAIAYPAIFTTSSGEPDLNGQMEMVDAATVNVYFSDNLGTANAPHMEAGGKGLHFRVTFGHGSTMKHFQINAQQTEDGKGYKGDASQLPPGATDDWTATDNGPEPCG
jgi:hypothetical protein